MRRMAGKIALVVGVAATVAALSSCSARQWYSAGQQWQASECRKRPIAERERCMSSNAMSYEQYQREAAEAKPAQ
ncbi:MAG: hypothetical protein R3E42_17950 [Burkholderiaceae bacterium]